MAFFLLLLLFTTWHRIFNCKQSSRPLLYLSLCLLINSRSKMKNCQTKSPHSISNCACYRLSKIKMSEVTHSWAYRIASEQFNRIWLVASLKVNLFAIEWGPFSFSINKDESKWTCLSVSKHDNKSELEMCTDMRHGVPHFAAKEAEVDIDFVCYKKTTDRS